MADRILVAGAGKSGIAATDMILKLGGEVALYDSNPSINIGKVKENFPKDAKVQYITGTLHLRDIRGIEICIISPGIDLKAPFVSVLREAGIQIWSEVQLGFQKERGTLVAITGTNGKTTTTTLTGEILKKKYADTFVVGNIGVPYTQTALLTNENSVTVLETSSFQLETITDFKPHVSAILNLTPDHLNRHGTIENYYKTKEMIVMNQTSEDFCVLNYSDPVLREFGASEECRPKVVWFSSQEELEEGVFLRGDMIIKKLHGKETEMLRTDELKILGTHNHENVMASIAIAACMDVPDDKIREACIEFEGVEHRIEFVRERAGVKYYNDSKGTNPDAAIKAVLSMPGPIVLIGGGYDKGSTYDEWVETFPGRVKYLILIGATRDKIEQCCKDHGFTNIMFAESMEEAVQVCATYADMGDCVLLSPACASWDMFPNYEERGRIFKDCVKKL